jgi:hypothetical protein
VVDRDTGMTALLDWMRARSASPETQH